MTPVRAARRRASTVLTAAVLALALGLTATDSAAQNWSVDWYTVDGGGEVLSETADETWKLSGTIGQPDATELIELSGNGWRLTGGFWAVVTDRIELLFRDGFEKSDAAQ